MCVGCTGAGKTRWVRRLLNNSDTMFSTRPTKIIYAYTVYQDIFGDMQKELDNFILFKGLPSTDDIENWGSDPTAHTVLCLDDLMTSVTSSKETMKLFTVDSHHRNISCIFLSQTLYPPGRYARHISLNIHYVILFRSLRDKKMILSTFCSQSFPDKMKFFKEAYLKATNETYGYLLVDFSPHNKNIEYQLRTHIFDNPITVYTPKI